MKSMFEYLNTINLYLLISAKKQIFAYFQYLVRLNKISQSLNFRIPYRGKKVGEKWQKPPNFSFPAYHISFNLMSRDIDIIFADVSSIFNDLVILWCQKIS